MSVYLNGMGVISAQSTFDKKVFENGMIPHSGNRWQCIEPDYSTYIDSKQIRRMSRIIRMSVTSSIQAVKEAKWDQPDAIVTGTALGCLEDTHSFLSKLVQYREDMLSPTAFIHSTHNTIASQVALHYKCYGYNSTYVHRALSFESALLDAIMLIEEGTANNVLAGGVDEITAASFHIMDRMNFFKNSETVNSSSFYNRDHGTVAGEGAAFYALSNSPSPDSYACIKDVAVFSFTTAAQTIHNTFELLKRAGIEKPDLLLSGHNGDTTNDTACDHFSALLNCNDRVMHYKHLCGEFATATGFGLWVAAEILKRKKVPLQFNENRFNDTPINTILIYNQQENEHHSLILLQSC